MGALLTRVAARDRRAFERLYAATSGKIYGVVARVLGRGAAAEDVLQDAYVRIWDRAAEFSAAKGSAIGWMATIARNRAIDEVRRSKRAPTTGMPDGFEAVAETAHPLDGRERGEALRKLLSCLSGLDAERREMILLAYYRGASREALAARFQRPVPTVKTLLHRGLAQLRTCLST
jgi:RNA polymerase sigma-70 factor (ECF subfamily)